MRLALFVCLVVGCLTFAKAQSFRYSKAQEFLDNYPIMIQYGDWIDIIENETLKVLPRRVTQSVGNKGGSSAGSNVHSL